MPEFSLARTFRNRGLLLQTGSQFSNSALSASYLSRILKEKCDFGFAEYLLQIRMEKAAAMLQDLQYKTYDIAYYVGYDNPKSFSHAFKNYYGVTPMDYRKGSTAK